MSLTRRQTTGKPQPESGEAATCDGTGEARKAMKRKSHNRSGRPREQGMRRPWHLAQSRGQQHDHESGRDHGGEHLEKSDQTLIEARDAENDRAHRYESHGRAVRNSYEALH
jgi:hypothetical protein